MAASANHYYGSVTREVIHDCWRKHRQFAANREGSAAGVNGGYLQVFAAIACSCGDYLAPHPGAYNKEFSFFTLYDSGRGVCPVRALCE